MATSPAARCAEPKAPRAASYTTGWDTTHVNHKRVERIWRQEGLKVPQKQPKKGRLWLNDGSCVRLRPERPNHVWSYDFVQDRTHDGRVFRTLNIIDEFTKEALVIRVKRRLNSTDVADALTDLFILRGPPEYIRSDNGAEFIAKKVRAWIGAVGAKTAFIAPGSPWENGYCESFNARFRDEPAERRGLHHVTRGPDLDRTLAAPLQHRQAAQRLRIPAAGTKKHRPDRPETDHALTFKLDHPMGALQDSARQGLWKVGVCVCRPARTPMPGMYVISITPNFYLVVGRASRISSEGIGRDGRAVVHAHRSGTVSR